MVLLEVNINLRMKLHAMASKNTMKFDFIFIDPPTFSNSKKMENTFEVEISKHLLLLASNCFKQDGVILYK